MGKALKKERRFTQASLDLFEPELEDAPEPEEGEEKGEPVLVNAEEKAELEGKLAAEQAKVDAATADVAEAEAALAAAEGVVEECKAKVASERAALLAAAEALQVRGRKNIYTQHTLPGFLSFFSSFFPFFASENDINDHNPKTGSGQKHSLRKAHQKTACSF